MLYTVNDYKHITSENMAIEKQVQSEKCGIQFIHNL